MSRKRTESGVTLHDCYVYMRNLEQEYGATVRVELRSDGAKYSGSGSIRALVSVPRLVEGGRPCQMDWGLTWPTSQANSSEGAVFRCLLEVEKMLADRLYRQEDLPF